jgi:hypothetical protein
MVSQITPIYPTDMEESNSRSKDHVAIIVQLQNLFLHWTRARPKSVVGLMSVVISRQHWVN